MMKTIFFGIFVLIFIVGAILLYKDLYVKRKLRRLVLAKYQVVEPLMVKLATKKDVSETEILTMVKDPSLRHGVFRTLESYQKLDLFPAEFLNQEKGAECLLVNWLEFPTELGHAPDEIELFAKVPPQGDGSSDYYVFRFRTTTPQWAARNGWMIGVAGPYGKESPPYDAPRRIYSRFNSMETTSALNEVQWVHENISQ
jgi:hypothetical protein